MTKKIASRAIGACLGGLAMCWSGFAGAATWGTSSAVTGMYMFGNSTWLYVKVSAIQNPESCSSGDQYLLMDTTALRFKEMYSILLTAQASGANVSLLYDGCTSGYPKINGVASPNVW